MKIILLFIFLVLFLTGSAWSQVTAGRVCYRQVLNLDSVSAIKLTNGKRAILYFTDTISYYVYNSTETARVGEVNYTNEAIKTFDIESSDDTGEVFMTNFRTKKIFMREFVWKKPYTAIDTLTTISWILTGEQRDIGGFACQKAGAFFRGRHFEAWFAPGIPVRAGPWKLQGLPGLILEACDDKNEVCYFFDSIRIPDKKIFALKAPGKAKQVLLADYRNLWKDETEKLRNFLQETAEKGVIIDVGISYFPIEKTYEY